MSDGKERYAFQLKIQTTRGTGTRDQDKVTGKVRADSLEELEERRDEMMDVLTETADEARSFQPDRHGEVP